MTLQPSRREIQEQKMKNYTQTIRQTLSGLLAVGAFVLTCSVAARAQEASTTYKSTGGQDPFVRYKTPVRRLPIKKPAATPVPLPSIQDRISAYKARKMAAISAQQAPPKPTSALLLSEVQVMGIFRTPRGYAAMVQAKPIKLSYVIYPGEAFFDGLLVAIEEERLVFRRETRWTDGRREVAVDVKPLRQPNVEDELSQPKTTAATTTTTTTTPSATPNAASPEATAKKIDGAPASEQQ